MHGLLFLSIQRDAVYQHESKDATPPIQIILSVATQPEQASKPQAPPHENLDLSPIPTQAKPASPVKREKDTPTKSNPPTVSSALGDLVAETEHKTLKLSKITSSGDDSALRNFRMPQCTAKQKHSRSMECIQENVDTSRRYADLVADIANDPSPTRTTIGQHLDQVGSLVAQSINIAALDPNNPAEAALIREQKQHLRGEILRIDSQLASVNLLRTIPIVTKAAKGLREQVKESTTNN